MKNLSLASACALLLFLSLPSLADSLSGKVADPEGTPVANADVALFDRNSGNVRKTTTSTSGEYSFTDIAAGRYLLEAQSDAIALTASEEVEVAGAATKDLTLSVARSAVRVIVSATTTPVFEQELARTIDIVDSKEINERVEYSLGEVLRTVPGVQVQTQVGGLTQVRTRGLPNQYTAVLIDGLRFRDAIATQGDGVSFLGDLNVTDMSRTEFLRGSGSSLYGTNAIAGAMSLNSNDGGGRMRGALRAEGGGLGFFRGTFNLGGGVKNDKLVYSGGASHVNVTSGVRGRTPNRNSSGQLFAKYNFTPKLSLSGRVWGADVFQRSVDSPAFTPALTANFPAGIGVVPGIALPDSQMRLFEQRLPFSAGNATFIPSVPDPDSSRVSSFAAAAFILRHELSAKTSWRASYQLVDTRRAFYDGRAGVGSFEPVTSQVSNFDGRTDQFQLRFDTEAAFNRVTAGYEFEREYANGIAQRNIIGGTQIRSTGEQFSHSFYAQDQVSLLSNRLQIVFGGRIQKFDLQTPTFTGATSPYTTTQFKSPENAYTGDVSIAYFVPTSNTKFRGHVGNGYRAPSLYERFGSSSFQGSFTFYGDPRLSPEKSISFDTGIDQWFFNNRVRASATFFYTDLSETILFVNSFLPGTDPFNRPFGGYRNSVGGGIARGVELSTQFSPTSKTSVTMSYSHNNSDLRSPSFSTYYYKALRIADNIFTLTTTQWITPRLNATVDFYYLGDVVEAPFGAGRLLAFPGPKKTDLVLNYKHPLGDIRSIDFYTKIENLGNVRYTDNGYLAPGVWAIAGMKYNF